MESPRFTAQFGLAFGCVLVLAMFVISSSGDVEASPWIFLNGSSEIQVKEPKTNLGLQRATWNMWINQAQYVEGAGLISKYESKAGQRSFLIRTTRQNSISILLSQDGLTTTSYTSTTDRSCGVRQDGEWTMITATYNGSTVMYYRNGKRCDMDDVAQSSLYNASIPMQFGTAAKTSFMGGVDEFTTYNEDLSSEQVLRLYNESEYGNGLGQSIPVLVYHRIEDVDDELITVTPTSFQSQMQYLKENGFKPVTMRHYANWRKGTYTMPKKAVILVFDDGWLSVYTQAKPIMDQYGFVGSLAVVTDYASGINGTPNYMNWNQTIELSDKGWSIEAHSETHSDMTTLNESDFRAQLLHAKNNITFNTRKTPPSFVFPFHATNDTYTTICGEYYELCWTQGSPKPTYDYKSTPGKEYLGLRRINIINDTTSENFKHLLGRDTQKTGEWLMNEGAGNTTADTSGKKKLGLLLGAIWGMGEVAPTLPITQSSVMVNTMNTLDTDTDTQPKKEHATEERVLILPTDNLWPDNMAIEE